ncbi:hypothetical protein [Paractinoplanes atraurantiacus]|uniref:40-residue YVTN family beta-propeller repeat-containing protein n=1 Tax=Paractinoplanes atraurantiacus TaxID=1036182 RepID=A0A285KQ05_9ACTN|nr:hypothetical protein [Actinoplanes atraurantiacus]SNY74293.1 hypothetical protein SAMN05421748_15112 [Actinoplanes atraurantiacus]
MLRAALTAVALAATTLVAGAAPAAATTGQPLEISAVSDVLVDAAHRRILISDGKSGTLVVRNYETFSGFQWTGLPGIGGLALSGDGKKIYAAVADAHAIVVYDAATMIESSRYALSDVAFPRTLAIAGDKLYFGWDKDPSVTTGGVFGAVDLTTGAIKPYFFPSPDSRGHGAPRLLTAPGAPDKLVVVDVSSDATSHGNTWVYDVSGDTPVETAATREAPGIVLDAALSPDGSKIYGVDGSCGAFVADTANPAQRAQAYGAYCGGAAVGIDPGDGRVALGYDGDDVVTFAAGSEAAADRDNLEGQAVRRLLWEPGGKRLFALGQMGGEYALNVLNEPVFSTISLAGPTTPVARGAQITISGRIIPSAPLPVQVPYFDVTRTDAESPSGKALPRVFGNSGDFTFSFSDSPPAGGTVTYTVRFPGVGRAEPAVAKVSVNVVRNTPVLTLKGGTVAAYGSTATVTARLGPTYSNRMIAIWADPAGAEPAKLLRNTKVDANGNLTAAVKLTRNTGVVAKFAGDTRYAPVSSPVQMLYTRVAVSLANAKQYKTATLGGVPTAYYRKTVHPVFTTVMTPYPKRKERLQFEVLWKGKWTASRTVDVPLTSAGKASYTLTGAHSTGLRYRVRAVYLNGASGDTVNYTTYGAYRYYTFTN